MKDAMKPLLRPGERPFHTPYDGTIHAPGTFIQTQVHDAPTPPQLAFNAPLLRPQTRPL